MNTVYDAMALGFGIGGFMGTILFVTLWFKDGPFHGQYVPPKILRLPLPPIKPKQP